MRLQRRFGRILVPGLDGFDDSLVLVQRFCATSVRRPDDAVQRFECVVVRGDSRTPETRDVIAERPLRPRPWTSPTVVVVFPSPSGVGVIAVTSMYFPRGRSPIRDSTSRCTFALVRPWGMRSSGTSP